MTVLGHDAYDSVKEHLQQVSFNYLFARAVLERKADGKVYVDNTIAPRTFYIVNTYGMSLLFGDYTNTQFNEAFREHALNTRQERDTHEWMQAFPNQWNPVLQELFGDKLLTSATNTTQVTRGIIEQNTRINFRFNRSKFPGSEVPLPYKDEHMRLLPTNGFAFCNMPGSVIPSAFWHLQEDFLEQGAGYTLYFDDEIAATAFSAYRFDNELELGIETAAAYRKKGAAQKVCAALIEHCIEHELTPVWACRLENTGSYHLAQKLGFEPSTEIPYYRLSN